MPLQVMMMQMLYRRHMCEVPHSQALFAHFAGLTVITDECDNIWSTKVEDEQAVGGDFIQRELEMYRLLRGTESPQPLSQGSVVRTFVQASIPFTHVCVACP